ncbi:MAG: diaminopimelate decarboxylase [Dehalococcoidia bacterium]
MLPPGAARSPEDHLLIAGCDTVELARSYGTPLYVYDENCLRKACGEFKTAFAKRYPETDIVYAGKAYMGVALLRLLAEQGLGLDVVSGGELAIAMAAGFPAERIFFHGNNKSRGELEEALTAGVGHIVIDNFLEIRLLEEIALARSLRQPALIRISPGVDPHTHVKTTTGITDTKFGFTLEGGQALEAVRQVLATPSIELAGFHFHLGSPVFSTTPYTEAIGVAAKFAGEVKDQYGFEGSRFSPGGGFAIRYTEEDEPPTIDEYAESITAALRADWAGRGLALPRLSVEPGRAIVGRAGVALYTVGAEKQVTGLRRYVSVDGGMTDNIRPALYDSRYVALLANRTGQNEQVVTIAGKFCESGDILIRDASIDDPVAGDVLAVPASGAYGLAMASNYNSATRPAVVFVRDGEARLVRRRETYDDLLSLEVAGTGEV